MLNNCFEVIDTGEALTSRPAVEVIKEVPFLYPDFPVFTLILPLEVAFTGITIIPSGPVMP